MGSLKEKEEERGEREVQEHKEEELGMGSVVGLSSSARSRRCAIFTT